jgi:hypothetical protein
MDTSPTSPRKRKADELTDSDDGTIPPPLKKHCPASMTPLPSCILHSLLVSPTTTTSDLEAFLGSNDASGPLLLNVLETRLVDVSLRSDLVEVFLKHRKTINVGYSLLKVIKSRHEHTPAAVLRAWGEYMIHVWLHLQGKPRHPKHPNYVALSTYESFATAAIFTDSPVLLAKVLTPLFYYHMAHDSRPNATFDPDALIPTSDSAMVALLDPKFAVPLTEVYANSANLGLPHHLPPGLDSRLQAMVVLSLGYFLMTWSCLFITLFITFFFFFFFFWQADALVASVKSPDDDVYPNRGSEQKDESIVSRIIMYSVHRENNEYFFFAFAQMLQLAIQYMRPRVMAFLLPRWVWLQSRCPYIARHFLAPRKFKVFALARTSTNLPEPGTALAATTNSELALGILEQYRDGLQLDNLKTLRLSTENALQSTHTFAFSFLFYWLDAIQTPQFSFKNMNDSASTALAALYPHLQLLDRGNRPTPAQVIPFRLWQALQARNSNIDKDTCCVEDARTNWNTLLTTAQAAHQTQKSLLTRFISADVFVSTLLPYLEPCPFYAPSAFC